MKANWKVFSFGFEFFESSNCQGRLKFCSIEQILVKFWNQIKRCEKRRLIQNFKRIFFWKMRRGRIADLSNLSTKFRIKYLNTRIPSPEIWCLFYKFYVFVFMIEMDPGPARAYFWLAVNKRPTHLWPIYFLRPNLKRFFLTRREKNWKIWPKPKPWMADPTRPWSKFFEPDPSL